MFGTISAPTFGLAMPLRGIPNTALSSTCCWMSRPWSFSNQSCSVTRTQAEGQRTRSLSDSEPKWSSRNVNAHGRKCLRLQSGRIRSRFYASRVNPRLGNHGADDPLAKQMIHKKNSDWLLPALLSTTAGAVDVIGFLALGGLFTAHITGNLVVLAAHYITGRFGEIAPLLSVPMFMVVLGVVTLTFA